MPAAMTCIFPPIIASTLVVLACASSLSKLPYCPAGSELQPLPSSSCLSSPGALSLQTELSRLVMAEVGPLLVRVTFDRQSSVDSVCAERSVARNQWRARARTAEALTTIYGRPAGPACLAGTRLDFNRLPAALAEAEVFVDRCVRDAQAQVHRENPNVPEQYLSVRLGRLVRHCMERHQLARDEVWVFGPSRHVEQIFRKVEDSASRRTVLFDCTEATPGHATHDAFTGFSLDAASTTRCMEDHGWEILQ